VFEMAHCLMLSGFRQYNPARYESSSSSLMDFIEQMDMKMSDLLATLQSVVTGSLCVHPLLPHRLLAGDELSIVNRVLEKEKKVLWCIYQGYLAAEKEECLKWGHSNNSGKTSIGNTSSTNTKPKPDANNLRSPLRCKLQTLSSFSGTISSLPTEKPVVVACARSKHCNTCSGDDGLSFSTLLLFAKEFLVCPEIISRQQLAELFNSVLLDPTFLVSTAYSPMDMIDQRITFCQVPIRLHTHPII